MNFIPLLLYTAAVTTALGQEHQHAPVVATNSVPISTALIDSLAEEMRTNNPSLLAADSRVLAARYNADGIRTWDDPAALFGGSVYGPKGFHASEEGNLAYGVEQRLPLWGRPGLAKSAARAELGVRSAEADNRLRQLRRDLTIALIDAALAGHVLALEEEDLQWLQATAKSVELKYLNGSASIADSLQIQNTVAERDNAIRSDRLHLSHAYVALNRLLNRSLAVPWPVIEMPPVADPMPFSEKMLTMAAANEPRLKVLDQELKQAAATAEITRKSRLPDVSLGVEARQFSDDGEFRSGFFTLRFSLPWANREKYRHDYERDRARQRSIEQERQDQVLNVREDLHHLTVELDAARREALLYRDEISVRAGQALSSRVAEWETGRGALRDVFDARRMALDARTMAARAIAEQNRMMADLLFKVGLDNLEAVAPLAHEPAIFSHGTNNEGHQH